MEAAEEWERKLTHGWPGGVEGAEALLASTEVKPGVVGLVGKDDLCLTFRYSTLTGRVWRGSKCEEGGSQTQCV